MPGEIRIEDARTHNLRGVHCRIPLGAISVVSGPSGSGKSSLAFDTLYAEGQRRYVASLSSYARQFFERLPRPAVAHISNLPPAIAIAQRSPAATARSTVGTATELDHHLRLLFARLGETRCCGAPVESGAVQAVVQRILARFQGQRAALAAPEPVPRGETPRALRERLSREGYGRLLLADGAIAEVGEMTLARLRSLRPSLRVVVDRLVLRPAARTRLAEAVAAGFARGGALDVVSQGDQQRYREGFACERCGRLHPTPEPALFSFDHALGACRACQGFGRVAELDWARVAPDAQRSLAAGAIAPFRSRGGRRHQRALLSACARAGVPVTVPWRELDDSQRAFVLEGGGGWRGVRGYFARLARRRYKVQARVQIARYRRFAACAQCNGTRLGSAARSVFVAGRHMGELGALSIGELNDWLGELRLAPGQQAQCGALLSRLQQRLRTALQVGIGYLPLSRPLRTLSGGEAQRIQLAAALGGALTAALFILDEPSVGLHARDLQRLLEVLRALRARGNSVVVVEHAPQIIAAADHLIELGPGAGALGGERVAEGAPREIARGDSLTGRVLRGELKLRRPRRRAARGRLEVRGARAHNLRGVDVDLPLGQLVVVSGVSGAGKSSLVRAVLGQLRGEADSGGCDELRGAEQLDEVVWMEPLPKRQRRANAATLSGAFEGIRRRFAAEPAARRLGLSPGWFSFNTAGGRCAHCEGSGETVVDMQFLEDLRVPCEACGGARYGPEAAGIRVAGRSIAEVLALSIAEVQALFAEDSRIAGRLAPFVRVGLGYVALGQPLASLSGGELQRMRIAQALAAPKRRTLFALDEPTAGLHDGEVQLLLDCLDELLDQGGSVVVVEHHLDVIRLADHVIDLGPEGGPGGGAVVAAGTPGQVARARTHTAAALRSFSAGNAQALAGTQPVGI